MTTTTTTTTVPLPPHDGPASPAADPDADPRLPPPVYTSAPSYSSTAAEAPPPPYALPKDLEAAAATAAGPVAHRIRWSRTAGTVGIIVTAAAVVAGGLYGYHQGIW